MPAFLYVNEGESWDFKHVYIPRSIDKGTMIEWAELKHAKTKCYLTTNKINLMWLDWKQKKDMHLL